MKNYLILVAGGIGKRMGDEIPKQFLLLGGKPLLSYSAGLFNRFDPNIETILVLPFEWMKHWQKLTREYNLNQFHHVVAGGKERFHSVRNGLSKVTSDSLVAIHDAVRPLVSIETIKKCFTTAEEKGNAIPVVMPDESVRIQQPGGEHKPADRRYIKLVQTPQVFRSQQVIKAYNQEYSTIFTDDATVVETAGNGIYLVEGNRENIKITTPGDLKFAESILLRE